ncbi:MAG TPA: glycoside hydrolase domain-containing protein [Streptosporangiaceae bacterium]|jgi:hypothetical protein
MRVLRRSARRRGNRRRVGSALSALLLAAAGAVVSLAPAQPARAYSAIQVALGFDACAAPTMAQMRTWWDNSPYWDIGIYIGGTARGCAQPNLTAQWLDDVQDINVGGAWGLLPIWVGPQSQCVQQATIPATKRFSNVAQTAYTQGTQEAQSAVVQAIALGFELDELPLVYDLEGFDAQNPANATCLAAAQQFIQGWTEGLHNGANYQSGVYGSTCSSGLSALADPPVRGTSIPDFIWGADYDGNPSTSAMRCVPSGKWPLFSRHKQFMGPHNETYGGLTINIDTDCSNGPLYYPEDRLQINDECI